jgi:Ca-activated chloride channel family protein
MAGKPFETAKQCAYDMVMSLRNDDRVAISAYGSDVEPVIESMPAREAKLIIRAKLDALYSAGSTALHAGWLDCADQVAPHVSQYGVSRIGLLSDGQANIGTRDPATLKAEAAELLEAGISTSTWGLGNNFNEDLMTGMAMGGNAFYAAAPEDLMANFQSEFDILNSTVGRTVRLKLSAVSTWDVPCKVEVLNLYATNASGAVMLPDLVAGAEVWAAIRVSLAADVDPSKTMATPHQVKLTAVVTWNSADGVAQEPLEDTVRVMGVGGDTYEGVPTDEAVAERVKEAEAARLQLEAKRQAQEGDWDGARDTVAFMTRMAGSNAYVAGVAGTLNELVASRSAAALSKEVTYGARAMSSRYSTEGEDVTSMEADRFGMRKSNAGKSAPKADGSAKGAKPASGK